MKQHLPKPHALRLATVVLGLAICQSALATPGQAQLSTLQMWLLVSGGTIITIALMYVALKMMFQKTPFHELSHVFFGGILFGAAPMIGAMLIGS